MNIIEKIRKLQWERGWNDYRLSQESGISQSSLATLFARNTPPKIDMLQRICAAFGITLAQFFLEDEQIDMLSENEKKMLSAFRKLPPEKQRALTKLLDD